MKQNKNRQEQDKQARENRINRKLDTHVLLSSWNAFYIR